MAMSLKSLDKAVCAELVRSKGKVKPISELMSFMSHWLVTLIVIGSGGDRRRAAMVIAAIHQEIIERVDVQFAQIKKEIEEDERTIQ
jgi:hypothetical protein